MDLEEVLAEQIARLAKRYPDHRIGSEIRDLLLVRADSRMLSLAIRNVIDNACKHTPASTQVRVGWFAANGSGELRVEDSGPGIPEALQVRVFDRFFRGTTQPGVRGLGLGLSICQSFMELIGGTIRYFPSELGGAGFALSFPRSLLRTDDNALASEVRR